MTGTGFLVNLHRCVGCGACVLACRIENGRRDVPAWRRVLPLNLTRRAGGPTYFFSVACHHCENPACLRGCPSRAYEKRAVGIVVHHESRCLGCRYCEMTCPFGAPVFDEASGVVSKCHLCYQRIDRGLEPACVAACPTEALRLLRGDIVPARAAAEVPGFVDPGACRPALRFVPPRGSLRETAFRALEALVKR